MKQKLFENTGGNRFKLIKESTDPKYRYVREGLKKVFASAEGDLSYNRIETVGLGYIRDISEAKICALNEAREIAADYGFVDDENHSKFVKSSTPRSTMIV
jgi:hypothetical protein